ncbi:MAG: short-chain dehydrogenase/reductase, partial [Francisellaceae bacterium]|nr:short-chain dehydrogenase/reductase [Francisellaceae bacterium]
MLKKILMSLFLVMLSIRVGALDNPNLIKPKKTILITGASGGIGQATAYYLASQNYNLILSAKTESKLLALKKDLEAKYSGRYEIAPIDFLNKNSFKAYQQKLDSLKGTIDGLVILTPRPSYTSQGLPAEEDWLKEFKSTFTGPMELLKLSLSHMPNASKIVIISGVSSVQYLAHHPSYGVIRKMWLAQAKHLSFLLG